MPSARAWFPYRKPTDACELFAFAHAGAGSTVFSGLREALSGSCVALVPAVLPGRERRLRDAPHRDLPSLLAEFESMAIADEFSAFTGDYALLGHCSGAIVAFEIARLLEAAPCRGPRLLVVCSCLPPPLIRDTGTSRLPAGELFARTAELGGTPDALLADPEFLEMLERPLRADWELFDGYAHRPGPKLKTPILAVRGVDDPDLPAADLERWRDQTSGGFSTLELAAGHWALADAGAAVLAREIPAVLGEPRG
ncbi:thioesterase II family protein [Amycolatopsis sacchari]|uniref:thioesterase II family protein n=1 Tax=Amycolatopsis sacchari TaxID=115433 RepID=UPI003D748AD9